MSNYRGFTKKLPYGNITIPAKVRDAKQKVVMVRNKDDGISGRVSDPERCMNANCAMRHANDGTFPHPVLAAWFIKSIAYLLESQSLSKGKYQVVRYRHRNWKDIEEFDRTPDPAVRARRFSGDKKIILSPLTTTKKLGADRHHNRGRGSKQSKTPTGRVGLPRGMNARFITLRDWNDRQTVAAGVRAR